MTLLPGCRFMDAPHFPPGAAWEQRLHIGSAAVNDGQLYSAGTWRPPTHTELACLLPEATTAPDAAVRVFPLPAHLRAAGWNVLEQVATSEAASGFDAYLVQVSEFLAFKGLALPAGARGDLVLRDPARERTPLRWSLPPETPATAAEAAGVPALWGGINLGDEASAIVILNVRAAEMAAALPAPTAPESVSDLAGRFHRAYPGYPLVRLTLAPGEGYCLPRGGVLLGGCHAGQLEIDVQLGIYHPGGGMS